MLLGRAAAAKTVAQTAKDGQIGRACDHAFVAKGSGALDQVIWQEQAGLPVHADKVGHHSEPDHTRASEPPHQALGSAIGASPRRLRLPFIAQDQRGVDVSSGRTGGGYLENVWARVRGFHAALSRHHPDAGDRDVPALRFGRRIAFAILGLVGSDQLLAAETSLESDLSEIIQAYEVCLNDAKDRAAAVSNEALRPRFFDAKADTCARIRDANLSTAYSKAGIAATQRERLAIETDMAAMTDALLAGARADLGLPETN